MDRSQSAEPLGAILEGMAKPLGAHLEESAKHLETADFFKPLAPCESEATDSHSTQALAEASPDFQEKAWVLEHTNLGPLEVCKPEQIVLRGQSKDT